MRLSFSVAALLLAGVSAPALAAPSKEAIAFGARDYVQDISLSPDGQKVAMIQPDSGRGSVLTVADFTSGKPPKVILRTSGNPDRLTDCHWVTTSRLICEVFFVDTSSAFTLGFDRLIALNDDGGDLKMVSDRTTPKSLGISQFGGSIIDYTGDGKNDGSILMLRSYVPEKATGTLVSQNKEGIGVDLVNTSTLTHRGVEAPRLSVDNYITDGLGHVRVIATLSSGSGGYIGSTETYGYRKPDDRAFTTFASKQIGVETNRGLNPVAVDPKTNMLYAIDDQDGRRALVRIALDGTKTREIVLARPDVDVDDVIQIGRQQRVVGASWVTEKREARYFDPELDALTKSLAKALPKQPQVAFVDASADEKQLLLRTSADNDPGRYYLFDKATRHLEEVMPSRPRLDGMTLASMKPISFKAADGTTIPGYLTLPPGSNGKNLPAIVMPHGGPAARDEWGFDWLVQFFATRGYAVLQPNFRGSAGYGDAWFQKNGFQSWRTAIGDVDDGGRWLLSQGIAAPGKLAIVGWSYGGYAALQSSVLDSDLFKAIVAIAPVTDLEQLRNESRFFTNFPLVDREIGSGPHVRDGSPAKNVDKIKAPVLMFHGDLDRNVNIEQSRFMAGRLRGAGKSVELVEYKGLDHALDDSAVRAEMLDKSDAFLRQAMGL